MTEQYIIKNGKEFRKWATFFISLILILIAGISAFASLQRQVEKNGDDISRLCAETRKATDLIHKEGTVLSRTNQRDIIGLKKDVQYTALTVKKIATKLDIP